MNRHRHTPRGLLALRTLDISLFIVGVLLITVQDNGYLRLAGYLLATVGAWCAYQTRRDP